MDDLRITLRPSRPRLWFAIAALGAMALGLFWLALAHPLVGPGWRAGLLVACLPLVLAIRALLASGRRVLILTREGLFDSVSGDVCRIGDIARVERGIFALRPARGFALRLTRPLGRRWVPGLWWRFGRNLGVGGLTGAAETRLMAEVLDALLAAQGGQGGTGPLPPSKLI
jgi:hypothetical protein